MMKLLTIKDYKTGRKGVFNPITIASITQNGEAGCEGTIIISSIGEQEAQHFTAVYEDIAKRWQEAVNL